MTAPASASPVWPVSIKGVCLVGAKVVLLRNERDEWELPGGRLEAGEDPVPCLKRELEEELGIAAEIDGLNMPEGYRRSIRDWVSRLG